MSNFLKIAAKNLQSANKSLRSAQFESKSDEEKPTIEKEEKVDPAVDLLNSLYSEVDTFEESEAAKALVCDLTKHLDLCDAVEFECSRAEEDEDEDLDQEDAPLIPDFDDEEDED
jgi:hypothetical protein